MKKKLTAMLLAAGAALGAWARTYTAADLGKVVCSDGSVYANATAASDAGKTARAMIACVDGNYVLAIALADTSTTGLTWSEAIESVGTWAADKAIASGQWRLPSADDYKRIFAACGGSAYTTSLTEDMGFSWGDIQTMLSSAGGTQFDGLNTYWLSDEASEGTAWGYRTNLQKFRSYSKSNFWCLARAVLAFGTARTYKKVQLWENGPYWAETNIGADEAWDYGYYFWWGDTVGYYRENNKWVASDGSSSNFQFFNDPISQQTYNKSVSTLESEVWIVNENGTYVLAPEHDAAQVQWGGGWRMPTYQELSDLNSKCDWTWTTQNGVNGYIVRGRGDYASNSIFFPCCGYGNGTSLDSSGSLGYYWSSVPRSDNYHARYLYFDSGYHGTDDYGYRYLGFSVRPVQDAPTTVGSWTSGDCTVTLDSAGALTVSGTGAMAAYESSYSRPWYDNCNQIKSVVIEHGVTNVGDNAFYDCGKLTSVTIGNGITSIGENAFRNCSGLTSVTIPDSVTSIGSDGFYSCSGLTNVTIGSGVTSIGSAAFRYCSGLTSVTIPDGVTSLGSYGFSGCSGLTNVTIGTGVTSIELDAFSGCKGLTSVTIPDGVTIIGENAFRSCSGLTSVTIPYGVTRIGQCAFDGCIDDLFDTKTIPGVKLVGGWAVGYTSSLSGPLDLTGVRGIGESAFSYCSGLTGVTIPGGVARIGNFVFSGCSGLTSVTIPNSVTNIGDSAFSGCSGLTSVTIPNSVTSIGFYAFRNCSGLTSATIGNGVTSIANQAFYGCTALADVKCYPDAAGLSWRYARDDVKADGSTVIHVKASQLAAYQAKFSNVKATFVGDLDMTPEIAAAITAISAIGDVAYTDECKAKIDAARTAYDALSDAQRALVANYATLTAAEAAYAALAPAPVEPEPVPAPCYAVIDEGDITEPYAADKAVTLLGVVYDGCDVVGIVELKLGKVNAKKQTSKVSGSVTTLDGKKHSAKGVNVDGIDGTGSATVSLEVKGIGTMDVTIGGSQFVGTLGGTYHVQSAAVGGAWAGGSAVAAVEPGDLSVFAGNVLSDFLPTNEVAAVSGGKWKFAKAASVKWAKPKKGAALPEIYDATSGKGLVVDTAKGTNLSGLKLTYTPKKGSFKGTFNVYALEESGSATKLKKYKMNVTGVVVDGTGYGVAKCKKPVAEWSVTVK